MFILGSLESSFDFLLVIIELFSLGAFVLSQYTRLTDRRTDKQNLDSSRTVKTNLTLRILMNVLCPPQIWCNFPPNSENYTGQNFPRKHNALTLVNLLKTRKLQHFRYMVRAQNICTFTFLTAGFWTRLIE